MRAHVLGPWANGGMGSMAWHGDRPNGTTRVPVGCECSVQVVVQSERAWRRPTGQRLFARARGFPPSCVVRLHPGLGVAAFLPGLTAWEGCPPEWVVQAWWWPACGLLGHTCLGLFFLKQQRQRSLLQHHLQQADNGHPVSLTPPRNLAGLRAPSSPLTPHPQSATPSCSLPTRSSSWNQ